MLANPYNLTEIQKEIVEKINQKLLTLCGDSLEEDENLKIYNSVLPACVAIVSDEFGSAVCISEKGYIMCCAHSAYYDPDLGEKTEIFMMFPNGDQVITKIVDRDEDLDIAIVKIVGIKGRKLDLKGYKFPYANISKALEVVTGEHLFCIGNPCFLDMENLKTGNERNRYEPFWVSRGKVLGYMDDKVYGNISLGGMKHSCWTYWGHSGGPLFNLNGEIVGLHNSWDDKTCTRHGVSLEGINKFISKITYL
jgi:hypothetical protein